MGLSRIVRYTTRPDAADENARLIARAYDALGDAKPDGFRSTTYLLDDGVTFVHVVDIEGTEDPLASVPEFAEFQQGLMDRVVAPPESGGSTVVGSYSSS